MKGKIFALLFALPFFGVGVFMAYSIGSNLFDASRMSNWEAVQASLRRAGVESRESLEEPSRNAEPWPRGFEAELPFPQC